MPLPQFNRISIIQIKDQLQLLLQENLDQLNNHLKSIKNISWDTLIPMLESLENKLDLFWSPVQHLHAVKSTPELREMYQACLPLLTDYQTTLGHHPVLYQAFVTLKTSQEFGQLNSVQQRLIELNLRDFHLAGVDLPPEKKQRYVEIERQLAELTSKYGENLLDATQHWFYLVSDEKQLQGLPEHTLHQAKAAAQQHAQTGWRLTLDQPCYMAVQRYADDRVLREKFYAAYVTRASELGDKRFDNSPIMQQILALRYELAKLLGFDNYALLSLATKMAKTPEEVLQFLQQLVIHARPAAKREYQELTEFAGHELKPWDINYYGEQLNQQRFHFNQEQLRPYFQVDNVIKTLFSVVQKIFGIHIRQLSDVEGWHPDVRCYEIIDSHKARRGIFYMDLYVREHKREGAWMDDYCSRWKKSATELQTPVAFLTCNFAKPSSHKPGLLTHDDVITLFHEFGHGLHHLLTTVDYLELAGMHNVPWDTVEFPSQFMENWCWQGEVLKTMAKHVDTNETLPDDLLDSLLQSRFFHAGLQLVRQLEFALFDFHLHIQQPNGEHYIQQILNQVREQVAAYPIPEYNRFQNTFSHIFDGGYAAGYYSYLWAEVLSSDAFSLFEEQGIFNTTLGALFMSTILAQGGAQSPEKLFIEFRGREPDAKALLKSWGLLNDAN
jgi:oligopeptidase A